MYKAYQLSQNDCMDGCCELCGNCTDIQIKKHLEIIDEMFKDS